MFRVGLDDNKAGIIAEVHIGSVVIECKLAFVEVLHGILIQERDG